LMNVVFPEPSNPHTMVVFMVLHCCNGGARRGLEQSLIY
jgi:hypothetical protein